jgi:hypothetical protein
MADVEVAAVPHKVLAVVEVLDEFAPMVHSIPALHVKVVG